MYRRFFIGLVLVILFSFYNTAQAYNCEQSCRAQAMYRSPWGTKEVNPLKQAACQTWKHTKCHDISACSPAGEVGAKGYSAAAGVMRNRALTKYKRRLNQDEKNILRAFYSASILDSVMLHFDVAPLDKIGGGQFTISMGSQAQTFGHNVYLSYNRNYAEQNPITHTRTVGHELKHSAQYEKLGKSMQRFGREYFEGWCKANFRYQDNVYEREAFTIDQRIEKVATDYYQNRENRSVSRERRQHPPQRRTPKHNNYVAVCVSNKTQVNLNYEFRWGSSAWQSFSVEPSTTRGHYFNKSSNSPTPFIKFDQDMTRGVHIKEYHLNKWEVTAPACNIQQKEEFKIQGSMLDLYRNY